MRFSYQTERSAHDCREATCFDPQENERFLAHYQKRSNVESTFSAVKRKFGDSVRSKTDVAMKNEVLCKLLAHNLTCLIQEQETLNIVPVIVKEEGQVAALSAV